MESSHRAASLALTLLAVSVLPACERSAPAFVPAPSLLQPQARPHGAVPVTLAIKVPPRPRCRVCLRPAYVSPATATLAYSIDGGTPVDVSLSASSPACATVHGALLCTVPIAAAPGDRTFSFQTLDSQSHVLSANTDVPFAVRAGARNKLSVTLGGVAASLAVNAPHTPEVTGTQAGGYTIYGNAPLAFTIEALDADGYAIVGTGAPQPAVSPLPAGITVATPAPTALQTWTLTSTYAATDPTTSQQTTLAVVATPVPNSGGSNVQVTIPVTLWQPWLYVTNNNGKILAYNEDGAQQTPSGSFPNLQGPRGIAYDTHNGLLYVADYTGNAVLAYDRTGHQHTLPNGAFAGLTHPKGIAFDSHNDLLYVASSYGGVNAFDEAGAAQTLSGSFAGLNDPYGVTYDPHNGLLYVTNDQGAPPVTAYDEQGNEQTLAGTWSPSSSTGSIAYDSANHELFVSTLLPADGGPGAWAFDEQGNVTVASAFHGTIEPFGIRYDPHRDGIFIVDSAGKIPLYDPAGKKLAVNAWTNLFGPQDAVVVP